MEKKVVEYYPDRTKSVKSIKVYKDGVLHCENGPACIKYHMTGEENKRTFASNGPIRKQTYYLNGKLFPVRPFEPTVTEYGRNGNISAEIFYNEHSEIHREDGPAYILYHYNGNVEYEMYMRNGKMHRDIEDGPASIQYDENGKIKSESFVVNGKIFRDNDRPAQIAYHDNGKIRKLWFMKDCKLHRDGDKPAVIRYYYVGSLDEEIYYQDGEIDRPHSDRPAHIQYYVRLESTKATIFLEEYYVKSKLHRDNGPARLEYDVDGNCVKQENFRNGFLDDGTAYPACVSCSTILP